ncbi:hypothetical protein GQ457_08G032510 [Hibiscus cannabinus]
MQNELATDVILQSLSDSFKQFIPNFNMNEIDKSLSQLLGMLRTAEKTKGYYFFNPKENKVFVENESP